MISPKSIVHTECNSAIRIKRPLGAGGQAQTFEGQIVKSTERVVVKVFSNAARREEDRRRSRQLVDMNLAAACPAFCAPGGCLRSANLVGHVSAFFDGAPLSEIIYPPSGAPVTNLADNLALAVAVSHAFAVLHESLGIVHGDIQPGNVLFQKHGGPIEIAVIDFDNWTRVRRMPGDLPPPMAGHLEYMAPELRSAFLERRTPTPNLESDRFALAVLLQEIILQRHPGIDLIGDDFHAAMSRPWKDDPALGGVAASAVSGYASVVLNTELLGLFRRSIHPEPGGRAPASAWRRALCDASRSVHNCAHCRLPFVADAATQVCPLCRRRFHPWEFGGAGSRVRLDSPSRVIGRDDLGGSPRVSRQHCILRRVGPGVELETIGLNPIRLLRGSTELVLVRGKPVPLEAGDRLYIADVEVSVRPVAA